eukprot:CAMPEP_0174331434 /NCGR_PEP_ID=MMETSP0810-20121108/17482_1 /TAXON_ID=73025 ORGANISM="Eutreptiella gymnastica-like, Strain CCMP1594" /NCGR_SAMPLE_ID=MMETSP0810 /ASSEMBLY_ACC=CAM_ASM_000659 /LENGTH=570 /DNA_ID=CAMNT_0015447215 /DNA_START=82 /DNA_END=1791 /DNA_ORIENTATION=+
MSLPAIDGNRPNKVHLQAINNRAAIGGIAARRELKENTLNGSKSESELQWPKRANDGSPFALDGHRQVRSSLAMRGTPSPAALGLSAVDLPPLASPQKHYVEPLSHIDSPVLRTQPFRPTMGFVTPQVTSMAYNVDHMQRRAMAELDGELWNEKLDWGDFYREERQKQKAVLQARKQLEERIAQDSELQIEMWQRMMEQRDEDIHTFISSFLNNKRWHWVSAEINEREALERRMLVLIERHSYESMLDRFHKACEATHLLKLAYREKQERQEVEQLQRQEMEVKVQAWRQRREDVHRNLALMSTLDRELQAEFKEIHKSYARSHESVRFMRNVKDLQTKEAMMRDTIDKMEEEKRHLVYEKYHYAWQAVQEEETMASIREKYKEAEGAARAVWIREEAQARAAVVKARERQREVILQVQADVEEARRRETEALALAEELKQDYAEWKESAAFLSEVLEQEESAREEREVDENEAWQAFLQEVATFLREYREEEELYAIEQALEEWLWVEEQERACLADDEEADRAARVQGLRRALDAAYRATPAAQEFAALQRTLQREQEHFAAEYRESL